MRALPFVLLLPFVMPLPALAQTHEPVVAFSLGGGVTQPFHGDLDFIAPTWETGVRVGRGPVVVDVVFGQWRHTEKSTSTDVTISSPTGVLGKVDRIDHRTLRVSSRGEVDVLGRVRVGVVRVAGGGGVGVVTMRRTSEQTGTGCSPSVAAWCQTTSSEVSDSSFRVQGVGTVDVPLARWLSAYGAVRFLVPTQDVGASELQVTGGVRLGW